MEKLIACGVSSMFVGFLADFVAPWPITALMATLGAWSGYNQTRHGKRADLRVTNLEFHTSKRLWVLGPNGSVPRAAIVGLE